MFTKGGKLPLRRSHSALQVSFHFVLRKMYSVLLRSQPVKEGFDVVVRVAIVHMDREVISTVWGRGVTNGTCVCPSAATEAAWSASARRSRKMARSVSLVWVCSM